MLVGVLAGIGALLNSTTAVAIVASVGDAAGTAFFLAFGIAIYLLVHNDTGELGEVFT